MLRGLDLMTKEDLEDTGVLCEWLTTCSLPDLASMEEEFVRGAAIMQIKRQSVLMELYRRDGAPF